MEEKTDNLRGRKKNRIVIEVLKGKVIAVFGDEEVEVKVLNRDGPKWLYATEEEVPFTVDNDWIRTIFEEN